MTTCTTGDCGTGDWTGPQPGDPDLNSSLLTAVPAFGGIDVSWTYPSTDAHAIAHTILYRSLSNSLAGAVVVARVLGTTYYDRMDDELQRFYWVQHVSVHGTHGQIIGPAWATPRPLIAEMIERLSGRIDAGVLAQSLKTNLDQLAILNTNLAQEITDRQAGNTSLAQAIANTDAQVAQNLTFIGNETSSRTTADSALAEQLNVTAAALDSDIAAVQTYTTAEVTRLDGRVDNVASQVTQAISKAEDDLAVAQSALQTQITTNTNNISANASAITDVQSQAADNLAAAETRLQTNIDVVDGEVTAIGALYTAKVSVNGLVGGFGIHNDGTEVQAGFDVDTFWVGKSTAVPTWKTGTAYALSDMVTGHGYEWGCVLAHTSSDTQPLPAPPATSNTWWMRSTKVAVKPFIIADGVTYIDSAVIRELTADKITTGTLNAARIAAGSLNANKIQAGTITTDRLVTNAATVAASAESVGSSINMAGYSNATLGPMTVVSLTTTGAPVTILAHVNLSAFAQNANIAYFYMMSDVQIDFGGFAHSYADLYVPAWGGGGYVRRSFAVVPMMYRALLAAGNHTFQVRCSIIARDAAGNEVGFGSYGSFQISAHMIVTENKV